MNTKSIRRLLLVAGAVVVLLAAFGLVSKPGTPACADNVFSLQSPPFVGIASAQEVSGASIIEDEAGISAYFQASTSINLDDVRDVFRTIEDETNDYIIGSVPVANDPETYPESDDVHVYVHTDGWILAYYLAEDPASKIFDWRAYHDGGRTNITTKLENTIMAVADAAGVPFSSATYYDFRYPNATHLMLIVEWATGTTDSFEVELPGSFTYYERSWSLGNNNSYCYYHYHNYYCAARYKVNGEEIQYHSSEDSTGWQQTSVGTLTVSQLPPNQNNLIEVWANLCVSGCYGYGGLALVYRVP